MARTEVYTCDICKESKNKNDLAKLEITCRGIRIKDVNNLNVLKIDICPDCLKKKGFVVERKEEEAKEAIAQNRATLEDKIYDILEDMGVMFTE